MGQSAIIIGAGVIGIASAYALARRGWRVTIVDRASGPAMETSYANGAQLSYCYTDALGSPALLASLPSLMAGKGGVSFRLPMDADYASWLVRFALNCTAGKFRQNTIAVLNLAAESRLAMDRLREQHTIKFAHRIAGKIHLLYSSKDRRQAEVMRALKGAAGCQQQILARADLSRLDRALPGLDTAVTGAISTPSEEVGDPLMFSRGLLQILIEKYDVTARFECPVTAITALKNGTVVTLANGDAETADLAVVASAADSNHLLAPLQHSVPLQPMKGYSFEMPLTGGSPRISVTDGKRRLVFTNLGDRMRVAGIAELGNASREIDPERAHWLVNAARECLANGGDYAKAGKFWTGLRPVTPNSQPVIRRASKTLAINTGHGALGWTLAMGSGERLAELVSV
ncbi:FAD-dependent oxidoreductase [Erythrobacter insulae]|uniref:FAD-dependent oxidoreductase n=1 Tax=Erythrobacter insulae TaxID=2584124 RepID=A0A547PDB3_9SPHN|nr:FAD-dependent oxidoreductase [Erythrobacter insulae]TRD12119.1 FAD-dependent oxidoreductase [Erythrobacter insulae]